MVKELKAKGLYDSTLIVVTAKHGQSPVDSSHYVSQLINGTSPATLLSNANLLPYSESTNNPTGIGPTEDDISLIWLKNQAATDQAVSILEANTAAAGIGEIFYGNYVALNYNKPGLGVGEDPRTPDIIVTPNIGVTYSGSSKKLAEHGGFAHDDTNVLLVVANPAIKGSTVHASVQTAQVAPTILKALGIETTLLDGVRLEGTAPLPDIDYASFVY
jgi:arylsulfatase A-like enzyme